MNRIVKYEAFKSSDSEQMVIKSRINAIVNNTIPRKKNNINNIEIV